MLIRQMSLWLSEYVLDIPRKLLLKFHQNRVGNSWDMANIEFVWRWLVYAKSFSCLTQLKVMLGWVELWLSLGFDKIINIEIQTKHSPNLDSSTPVWVSLTYAHDLFLTPEYEES